MSRRVADVEAVCIRAVGLFDRLQAGGGVVEGRIPVDLFPGSVGALAQRTAQSLGILVDLFHRVGLGTEIALAPLVLAVALDAEDAPGLGIDLDVQSATRLAGRAGAMNDPGGGSRMRGGRVGRGCGHLQVPRTFLTRSLHVLYMFFTCWGGGEALRPRASSRSGPGLPGPLRRRAGHREHRRGRVPSPASP